MQSDASKTTLSLAEAHDALSDLARQFHNDMLRQGTKELPAGEWLEEFRSWLPSARDFAEEHDRTIKFLEECDRRAEG